MRKIGIIGPAQAGKTTLYRTVAHAHSTDMSGAKPQTHIAVVHVPDRRLERLSQMFRPQKTVHSSLEFVDTPGSVIEIARAGAETASLREMDALTLVLRAFDDPSDPRRDVENVELEMMLSDLAAIEKRLLRLEKDVKKQKNPALEHELEVLKASKAALEMQTPLREVALAAEEERIVRGFCFLSSKPLLYVLNVGEKDAARVDDPDGVAREWEIKTRPGTRVASICGKVEAELSELGEAEANEFMASYGLKESAVARLIGSCYKLLGLISFFTIDGNECRAWTIREGTTALQAAGEIHTDLQKGFIRAEVIGFEALVSAGSMAAARSQGLLKVEGKEYVLHDGEVVHIRHSG